MEVQSCFSEMKSKDLILLLQSRVKVETISKIKENSTCGYDLLYDTESYLKGIGIENANEIKTIQKIISPYIYSQLQIEISYKNKTIAIQLENDLGYTTEKLLEELKKIFNVKDNLVLTDKDGKIILPNILIINLILSNPKNYLAFTLYDTNNIPEYKKRSSGFKENNIEFNNLNHVVKKSNNKYSFNDEDKNFKNYPSNQEFIFDSKDNDVECIKTNFGQYSNFSKGKNTQFLTQNRSFIENKEEISQQIPEDTPNTTTAPEINNYQKRQYGQIPSFDINKYKRNQNDSNTPSSRDLQIMKEKDKEEIDSYIKKGYGAYPLNKDFQTEKRSFRNYQSNTPDHYEKPKGVQYQKEENNDNKRYSFEGKYNDYPVYSAGNSSKKTKYN